jgi:hypothetical protein
MQQIPSDYIDGYHNMTSVAKSNDFNRPRNIISEIY